MQKQRTEKVEIKKYIFTLRVHTFRSIYTRIAEYY